MLALTAPAASIGRTLQIADMARIVGLEEPAISADGRTVALLVIRQDMVRATYVNSLVLVDTRTGAQHTIVAGHAASVPRWSPDGSQLAYLTRATDEAGAQIDVRATASGSTRQLTHAAGDVIDMAWSPDGRTIAYTANEPPANAAALAAHHDYFFAGDNDYTAAALTPPTTLWTIPAAGGAARRLTSATTTIAATDPGGIFSSQFAWSRDARQIVVTRLANTFSGDDEQSTIWQIDVATRAARKLTGHTSVELSPSFSPDGSRLAYWYALGGDINSQNTVRVIAGGNDTPLAPAFDRNVGGAIWFPDSRRMLACGTDHTRGVAWIIDLAGNVTPVNVGDLNVVCDTYSSSTFDAGIPAGIARNGAIAFLGDNATHGRELYMLDTLASAPRRLTHFNDFIPRLDLGRATEFDWDGPDGFHEDGVVTYPPGMRAAAKYPVVVFIHGGPGLSSLRLFAWEEWPMAAQIAARGYIVFQPNYRGSDDQGNAFMHAIVGDSAAGPGNDVMSGLAALEKLPNVDSSRVAVCGWSYGGKLTTWLTGHSHAFRAAVSGAAVNDEFNEYNTSESNVQDTYLLGTSPYVGDGMRIYAEQSPISYYGAITTPTLIWGTTLDPVVPIPQAYALFHALRDNHVPVQFAVFPSSSHGPGNPVQTADLTRLWLDWLDRYLR
jgi:dipeptidyl aminopeptidase/acylaminoacyl peptidase